MWKGAPKEGFAKASVLRNNLTKSEALLWERLRQGQFKGLKFRRQHPVHIYIADFYCHRYQLIIEIDGAYHNTPEQIPKDGRRTKILEELGLVIIRFTNLEVETHMERVLEQIGDKIEELKSQT
ncbi:endonuclease domain-containing protein [Chryseobacterium sp.]|nr:endonuclease domain-containing protein [Chryseobacterium sp.]